MNQQILIYVFGTIAAALVAWLIFMEVRLSRVFGGKKAGDLEGVLREITKELEELHKSREDIEKYLAEVEQRLKRSVQYVGVIRFNPFQDSGSDQSFAIALMDEKKNGMVISSLYSREVSRLYAKPLEGGASRYQLSDEEKKSIEAALAR
ncbi:MAG: DUF4446 family protein [bacterium]|nr:DUF4446 family protein [bacterium]